MGKQRINIEKIEDKARRHIAFSKRRKGLFKKAAHLGSLGCEVAAVVISSSNNTFTFAHQKLDSVLDGFLDAARDRQLALVPHAEAAPAPEVEEEGDVAGDDELEDGQTTAAAIASAEDDGFWSEDDDEEDAEEDQSKMEEDRRDAVGDVAATEETENVQWWKQPVEGAGKEELEKMERAMMEFRAMAMERWKELVENEPLSLMPSWDPRSRTIGTITTSSTTSTSAKPPPSLPDELDLDLSLKVYRSNPNRPYQSKPT